jgi:hypothetical protein
MKQLKTLVLVLHPLFSWAFSNLRSANDGMHLAASSEVAIHVSNLRGGDSKYGAEGRNLFDLAAFRDPKDVLIKEEQEERIKILYAVIAIGDVPQRAEIIHENLYAVGFNQTNHGRYQIDCMLFSYVSYHEEPLWVHDIENSMTPRCQIVRIYKMGFVAFLKTLIPSLLRDSGYKYIFLSLDDVTLSTKHGATFELVKFFDIIESQHLHMASCAIQGGSHPVHWPQIHENPNEIGRFVNMIEIQATVFEINAWECFYELVDTEYPSGWGLDMWFWHHCIDSGRIGEGKLGIIDTMKIIHNPFNLATTNGADKDPMQLLHAQMNHWAEERDINLIGSVDIKVLGIMLDNEPTSGS